MKILIRSFVASALAVTGVISAGSQVLTADQVLKTLDSNILLNQMKADADAGLFAGEAENSLAGPEAEFEHVWGRGGARKWNVGITQSFDWPGLYSARRKAANVSYIAAGYEREAKRAELLVETKRLLVQAGFICQRRDVIDSMIADLTDLQKYLDEALKHGLVTIIDSKKAAIEIVNLCIERDALDEQLAAVVGQISIATGTDFSVSQIDASTMPATTALLSLDEYMAKVEADPMVIASKANVDAARLNEKVADRSVLPGFGVGYRHEFEEGTHFNGFAVSVSLPSWGVSKTRKASRMQTLAADAGVELQKSLYLSRVKAEYQAAAALRERIKSLRAVGMDGSYLQLLRMAREGGEISMLDYLREQSYYRATALSLLDLEERYALLLTSLNR